MPRRTEIACAVMAALLWVPAGTHAATGTLEADVEKLLPLSLLELIKVPVVTASRRVEARDHTPAHIIVVTREQIRERRYKNLADLLEDMPGVDFQRGTKSSQYNQFAIQGYVGPNRLVVMIDGVRIGQPAGGNFPVAENLALYQAKQVEFLYGPAAALYGADAVSGVVNIITDHAADPQGAWVSVGGGNFGQREASFMAGFKNEQQLALQVGGHVQAADRAYLPDVYPREFARADALVGSTVAIPAAERSDYVGDIGSSSLFARLDMGERLTLAFFRNSFHSLTSTGDPPATAEYLADSRWTTTTDTAYAKYRYELAPQVSADVTVDYSRMRVSPSTKYNNWYNGFTDGYSYVQGERLGIEQNLVWQIDARHRLQSGLGYQRSYAIEAASLPAPYNTALGPDSQGFTYAGTSIPMPIGEADFDNYMAYAQVQSDWNDCYSTMAGLRLDRHSNYGTSINPRLGGVWRVNERHVLKALYGEAFRVASPEESLGSFGQFSHSGGVTSAVGFRIPNLDLQPEKVKTLSLTWDWRPRQDVNLIANLYRSRVTDLVISRTLTGTDTTSIPGAVLINPESKTNAGWQRQHGLDLMAQWRFKLGGAWTGDLWSSAGWIKGRIDEGDGVEWTIPYVARNKFKLGTTLRYRDRFSVSTQVLRMGDTTNGRKRASTVLPWQCAGSAVAPDRCVTPGYTVVNLHLGWHQLLDGKASVWLDIHNLQDKRYYAAHGSASRTFYDMPQQPRTWTLSLDYRF